VIDKSFRDIVGPHASSVTAVRLARAWMRSCPWTELAEEWRPPVMIVVAHRTPPTTTRRVPTGRIMISGPSTSTVCRLPVAASGNRHEAEDGDAKPVTLIHPASCSNQQVRGLHTDESRGETTRAPVVDPSVARGNGPVMTVVIDSSRPCRWPSELRAGRSGQEDRFEQRSTWIEWKSTLEPRR
jgi:hypothetical protein